MATFPNSPRLLKGGIVLIDPETGACSGSSRCSTTRTRSRARCRSRRSARAATARRRCGLKGRRSRRSSSRRRSTRPISSSSRIRTRSGAARHSSAARGAGDDRLSDQRAAPIEQQPGAGRHAGDHADGGAADAVHLEQEPRRAGAADRLQRHRRGVRPALNPIRAKVSLGMRVLSVNDLGFDHKGGSLFMAYQQQKERLAAQSQARRA